MIHSPNIPAGHSDFPIQSLWIGKLGQLERLSMASFLANSHRYHLYAYDMNLPVPPGVELKDAREILPEESIFTYKDGKSKGGYSGFADLFRYMLLAQKGGWWADTDIICLKPFIADSDLILGYERTRYFTKKICIGALFATPEHPLLRACSHDALTADVRNIRFAQNGEPIMRMHVKRLKLTSHIRPPNIFNPINWWQSKRITRPNTASILPPESLALHCYAESWRWRMQDSNQPFSKDSLLGSLQHRYAHCTGAPHAQ